MKILYLNNEDLIGRRFNGFDIIESSRTSEHKASMVVWDKKSTSDLVEATLNFRYRKIFKALDFLSRKIFGVANFFLPFNLLFKKSFWKSDIIHIHLLSGNYFSLFELPLICFFKPTVITIHEFSPITALCFYPINECEQWKNICKKCPVRPKGFALEGKTERINWYFKKAIYSLSKFKQIVVATNWMQSRVHQSPLLKNYPLSVIPFGIDLEKFVPPSLQIKSDIRDKLGIGKDQIVVLLRSLNATYKNFDFILRTFESIESDPNLTILTVQELGLFNHLKCKFNVIDLGLVTDYDQMIQAYQASDIFIMPSKEETFGMMAVEAMACGLACVVSTQTVLQEVAGVPISAIGVSKFDHIELVRLLNLLKKDETLRKKLGSEARKLVELKYSFADHKNALIRLYESILKK